MTTAEFEQWVLKMPRAELGGLIKEYIAESNHGGWEGYNSRDMTGIRRFLTDLRIYHDMAAQSQDFANLINNVNPVP